MKPTTEPIEQGDADAGGGEEQQYHDEDVGVLHVPYLGRAHRAFRIEDTDPGQVNHPGQVIQLIRLPLVAGT